MAKLFNGVTTEPEIVEVQFHGNSLEFSGESVPLNKLSISYITQSEINLIIDGKSLELTPDDPHFRKIHKALSHKKHEGVKKGLTYSLTGFAVIAVSFLFISYISENLPDKYYRPLINEKFLINLFPGTCSVTPETNQKILTAIGEKNLKFFMIKLPAINALAYPFDQILITEEMLNSLRSDHELFAVLGHEAGHLRLKHYKGQLARMLFVDVVGSVLNQGQLGQVVETFLLNSYSRQHEREADEYAVGVLKKMHYPVEAGASLMELLKKKVPDFGPSFFSSHPVTKERIDFFLKSAGNKKGKASTDRTIIKSILKNCEVEKGP